MCCKKSDKSCALKAFFRFRCEINKIKWMVLKSALVLISCCLIVSRSMSAVSEATLEIVWSIRFLQVVLPHLLRQRDNNFELLSESERYCYNLCFDTVINNLLLEWDNTSMLDREAQRVFRERLVDRIRTLRRQR